jgi:protein N-terminal amidase
MSIPPPAPEPPRYRAKPLRIGCVQYDVKLGRVDDNAAKVEAMTAG